MNFNDNINTVKNIGETRTKQLNKLGIETVEDLVEYFPRDYKDRTSFIEIAEINEGDTVNIRAKVMVKPELSRIRALTIVKARLSDGSGIIEAVWFNQPYMRNSFAPGREYIFTGKVNKKYGRLQLENPAFEAYSEESLNVGRIVPVYTLPKKMSQKTIRQAISTVINEAEITEFMPENILKKYKLCNRKTAIRNIHFPENDNMFFAARTRLVFEELFLLQLRLLQLKGNVVNK